MRNVIFGLNISIDACYEHTIANPDEEIMDYFTDYLQDVDLEVYGRITYELMVPYWPEVSKAQSGSPAENRFADRLTAIDKVVFSRTLDSVEGNARIVHDNLEGEMRRLKQLPGKKISIGGVNLRSQLMALGLIDEFYFVVHPLIAAQGKRLMEGMNLPEHVQLKLVDCKVFKSGALGLHYVKA